MKVRIEFYRKCFYCLFETPDTKTLIWENGDDKNQSPDIELSDEDLGIMLNQLHGFNNIVCENCGTGDSLAFAVVKVNDKSYNDLTNEKDNKPSNDFAIHNEILRMAKSSLILFKMRDGTFKIAAVDGVMTSHGNGEKSYATIVYFECDEIDEIENFDYDNGISFQYMQLSEIKEIEHFTNLDNIDN